MVVRFVQYNVIVLAVGGGTGFAPGGGLYPYGAPYAGKHYVLYLSLKLLLNCCIIYLNYSSFVYFSSLWQWDRWWNWSAAWS